MDKLTIANVAVEKNVVKIDFKPSKNVQKYLNEENHFFIEYNYDISKTPKSIAVIPFIANVLPMSWFADVEIVVDELDEDFYNSIPQIQNGYKEMAPMMNFKGKISPKKLVKNQYDNPSNKKLLFFSCGIDSYYSYTKHHSEDLELLSIWGSDIYLNQEEGWNILRNLIVENFKNENRDIVLNTAKTNFRDCLNYPSLAELVKDSGDEYWHGFQHSIGIICLSAPLIFTKQIKTIYFASTRTKDTLNTPCASRPSIDESVKFAETSVIHDGFEANRLQKVLKVTDYYKTKTKPHIHICWEKQTGLNCGTCNKCIRTVAELLCAKANPKEYGIPYDENSIQNLKTSLQNKSFALKNLDYYKEMQDYINSKHKLKKDKDVNWILDINTTTGEYCPKPPKLTFFFRAKRKIKHIAKKILRRK